MTECKEISISEVKQYKYLLVLGWVTELSSVSESWARPSQLSRALVRTGALDVLMKNPHLYLGHRPHDDKENDNDVEENNKDDDNS